MKSEDLKKLKEKLSQLSESEKKLRNIYLRNISNGSIYGPMTGYASIDKPWLKYYNEENINSKRDNLSAYEYMRKSNTDNLSEVALSYMNVKITYQELLNKIDEATKSLIALGVKKGDVVTLVMANIPESVYLFYALNRIGAIANMVDPRLKTEEIIQNLKEINSKTFVAIDTFLTSEEIQKIKSQKELDNIILVNPITSLKLSKPLKSLLTFKKNQSLNYAKNNLYSWEDFLKLGINTNLTNLPEIFEENPAIMVRTGGTTGMPKTVILSNKNLNEMAHQHALGDYNFEKGDLFLNFLPPFIAYGICCATHMPLSLGLNIQLIPKFDAKEFPKLMKKYRPNVVFGGPILYEKMMLSRKTRKIDLSNLKVPVSGGDTMDVELERNINDYFKKNNCPNHIGQGYGMTEVSSSACYSKETSYCEESIGIPLINNEIAIFDPETMEEKQYGEEGEICLKSDTTMFGYFNNDEEYKKVIKEDPADGKTWVHTADIGKMNSSGNLFHIDRMKRIITSNGSKIFPTDIEKIISKNKEVLSCTVVGAKHKVKRTVPVAHIVLKDKNTNLDELVATLDNCISSSLPDHYLPYAYVFRKEMPLTSINKVNYKALEEQTYSYKTRIIIEKENKKEKRLIRSR